MVTSNVKTWQVTIVWCYNSLAFLCSAVLDFPSLIKILTIEELHSQSPPDMLWVPRDMPSAHLTFNRISLVKFEDKPSFSFWSTFHFFPRFTNRIQEEHTIQSIAELCSRWVPRACLPGPVTITVSSKSAPQTHYPQVPLVQQRGLSGPWNWAQFLQKQFMGVV